MPLGELGGLTSGAETILCWHFSDVQTCMPLFISSQIRFSQLTDTIFLLFLSEL